MRAPGRRGWDVFRRVYCRICWTGRLDVIACRTVPSAARWRSTAHGALGGLSVACRAILAASGLLTPRVGRGSQRRGPSPGRASHSPFATACRSLRLRHARWGPVGRLRRSPIPWRPAAAMHASPVQSTRIADAQPATARRSGRRLLLWWTRCHRPGRSGGGRYERVGASTQQFPAHDHNRRSTATGPRLRPRDGLAEPFPGATPGKPASRPPYW